MALAIKPTPVLRGKEAMEFAEKIEANKNRPVSDESYQKIKNAFQNIKVSEDVRF
ncbi:MAG: hypothetical protein JW915_16585 [Chitinispirillaceae bacterium]|nr:hypothetical protein [Chitinispirillaceae bacterium]